MKFCQSCGAQIPDGCKSCTSCGATQDAAGQQAAPNNAQQQYYAPPAQTVLPNGGQSRGRGIALSIIAMSCGLCGLFSWYPYYAFFGLACSIAAIICGAKAKRSFGAINGLAVTGLVFGIIGCVLSVIGLIFTFLVGTLF